ncbi:MAG: ABC transporter ATP-binding protein [Alphaproteobacteria bacterium]
MIEISGLHAHYGSSHVLHGVDLTIQAGECVSLLGRNGMGKTTTIRCLFGLLKPSEGAIRIQGQDMTGAPAHKIARAGLALVPENREIFPNLTVEENLVMASRPGIAGQMSWNLKKTLATFPRLAERLEHMGDQLSGGEQQMLAIGRALMTNPDVLVLDEATEGLAPLVRQEIWAMIAGIRATGIAVLIVDKDLNRLLELSDRAVILEKGRTVYTGTASDLAANPHIQHRHLGV